MVEKQAPPKFDMLDREDEEQILDELRGIPVDKFVYKNKRGVWELTYAGTKWAVRKMAERGEAIRVVGHPEIILCPMDSEYIVTTVVAERVLIDRDAGKEIRLDSTVGSSRNWKKQTLRDGGVVPDDAFLKKSVSIATRNVQQMLMPFEFKKSIIDELAAKSGKPPERPPSRPAQQAPPPAGGKKTEAKKPAEQKPPENPNAPDPKLRQKLHIVMGRFIKDSKEKKQAFVDLTGKQQTSELDGLTLSRLTAAFERMGEGKVNELRKIDGKFTIFEKPTGNTLFPETAKRATPASEAPPANDSAAPQNEEKMF